MQRYGQDVRTSVLSEGVYRMEELARKLTKELNGIGIDYYLYKKGGVIDRAQALAGEIRDFCGFFLNGNVLFGMDEADYSDLNRFVVGVLEDYMEALSQRDTVLMLDTLDYGLRELLRIFTGEEPEENANE